jgi:enoyl-CoA hydratase
MTKCVEFKTHETITGAGIIEISRPEALNALNQNVLDQLSMTLADVASRTDLSVIVLRSAGDKAFVAGADIKEMLNFKSEDAHQFSRRGQAVFEALSSLPQVVIAQIQGFALGGGLELALAADFMIASQNAKFGLPEVGLGLIPGFGGTQRLVERIGYARALEWMTSTERYPAETAFSLGLLNRVVPADMLVQTVESLAQAIASQGPDAVRAAKQCARVARLPSGKAGFEIEAQCFAQRFEGVEAREGLQAFVEKRRPNFRTSTVTSRSP